MPEKPKKPKQPPTPSEDGLGVGSLLEFLSKIDPQPDKKDETIAALDNQIQELNNKHYEERFIWMLVSLILFDAFLLLPSASWAGVLVIGLFQLVAVVIMADRWKVDAVAPLLDRLTGAVNHWRGSGTNNPPSAASSQPTPDSPDGTSR